MKKTFAIFLAILLLFCLCIGISGAAEKSPSDAFVSRDGLDAALEHTVTQNGVTASVRIQNHSEFVDRVRVQMVVPEDCAYHLQSSDFAEMQIPANAEHTFSFELVPTQTFHSMWIVLIAAVVLVAVCVVVLLYILRRNRHSKQLCAFLLLGASLLLCFPTTVLAAEEERSFTLSDTITVDHQEFTVAATVSYNYRLQEIDVADSSQPDTVQPSVAEVVKTSGLDRFEITYYWGPHGEDILNEEYIKAIADCGFTSIPIENNSTENNKIALQLLKKYNLTCSALWDQRINHIVYTDESFTQEEVDAVIAEVVADYQEFDNLKGYYIMDEPAADRFENLAKVISAIRRLDPDHVGMVNLFPTYASAEQLGKATYKEYVNAFIAEVDPQYISYDHYHFKQSSTRVGFFTNLENIREAGMAAGLDQMQIILLTKHGGYTDVTPTQLTWEVNMSLVYGMKRISYFTYWLDKDLVDQGWTNACMSYTGEIYPHYYDVQAVNTWLISLGTELFSKQSVAVFHLTEKKNLETDCTAYQPYGKLGEIDGTDAVIGFFDDESFMIVNSIYQEGDDGIRNYTLQNHSDGLEYFDSSTASWKSLETAEFASRNAEGKYCISLQPGNAVLLRVRT